MSNRSYESPMDFEYHNKVGPADAASPFMKLTPSTRQHIEQREHQEDQQRPPQHSFGSEARPANPFTRPPFFAQQHNKPMSPQNKPHRPAQFSTPRKVDVSFDSSDFEYTSPENNADSEVTPDLNSKHHIASPSAGLIVRRDEPLNLKHKGVHDRDPLLFGKGRISKHQVGGIERRLKRRRDHSRRLSWWRRRDDSSSGSEADDTSPSKRYRETTKSSALVSFFGFINTHPDLPHILSFYVQLILNMFLVVFFIYLIYSFWATIRADVDKKSEEAVVDVMAEMALCLKQYNDNRCDSADRAPALDSLCSNWQRCMKRDPKALGRARVSAHTFAEIFNSFIEPISYKAMVFSLLLAFACFGTCNMAFGLYRNRAQSPAQQHKVPNATLITSQHSEVGKPEQIYWSQYQTPHTSRQYRPGPTLSNEPFASPRKKLDF